MIYATRSGAWLSPCVHSYRTTLTITIVYCLNANVGKASQCKHKLQILPPWKSAELQEKVEQILKNDEGLINRETKGLTLGDDQAQYSRQMIDGFRKNPLFHFDNAPLVLHTGIDPSGGGGPSEYAAVTIGFERGLAAVSQVILAYSCCTRITIIWVLANRVSSSGVGGGIPFFLLGFSKGSPVSNRSPLMHRICISLSMTGNCC